MTSFSTSDVLAACVTYGPQLHVPAGLEPVKVMTGIGAVESGGGDVKAIGHDCGPRHEPAYEANGASWARPVMAPLLAKYPPTGTPPQSPAAMSYGPWQMMFCNFTEQAQEAIIDGTADVATYAEEFALFFNSYVIRTEKAQDLDEIGEVWNAGHITPDPAYTGKLQIAYDAATSD